MNIAYRKSCFLFATRGLKEQIINVRKLLDKRAEEEGLNLRHPKVLELSEKMDQLIK